MFVSIYYKPSLFNAHTMILIFHIFMNVNKLCLNHTKKEEEEMITAQELCESRGGRPGLHVPYSPYGLCGRKAALNLKLLSSLVVGALSPVSHIRISISGLIEFEELA